MCSISIGRYLSIAAVSFTISSLDAAAAEPHDHPHHEVEKIVITADPLNSIDSHFAAPTTVLDKEELKKRTMRSIGETVANQPGVTSSDFGASVGACCGKSSERKRTKAKNY